MLRARPHPASNLFSRDGPLGCTGTHSPARAEKAEVRGRWEPGPRDTRPHATRAAVSSPAPRTPHYDDRKRPLENRDPSPPSPGGPPETLRATPAAHLPTAAAGDTPLRTGRDLKGWRRGLDHSSFGLRRCVCVISNPAVAAALPPKLGQSGPPGGA